MVLNIRSGKIRWLSSGTVANCVAIMQSGSFPGTRGFWPDILRTTNVTARPNGQIGILALSPLSEARAAFFQRSNGAGRCLSYKNNKKYITAIFCF
jgi:hypothetical protein